MIQTIRDAESKIWTLQKEVTYLKTKINELENQLNEIKSTPKETTTQTNVNDWLVNSDGSEVSHRLLHRFRELEAEMLKAVQMELENLTVTNKITTKDIQVTGTSSLNSVTANSVSATNATFSTLTSTTGSITNLNGFATNFTDKITGGKLDILNESVQKGYSQFWGTNAKEILHVSSTWDERGFSVVVIGDNVLLIAGCRFQAGNWIATSPNATIISMNTGGIYFYFFGNVGLTVGAIFTPTVRFTI